MLIVLNLAIVVGFVSTFIITRNYIPEITDTDANQISNKKFSWGIRRNSEHKQPDVGTTNRKILEDNKEKLLFL